MTKKEYEKIAQKKSPASPVVKNTALAFAIGGLICAGGQAISNYAATFGYSDRLCSAITAISLIFISALLTGLKVFDNIAKFAGAGTIVPITGFANSVVSPAMEFKSEGMILGMGAKMFTVAGPVLLYGISASVIYGIILVLFNI